MTITKGQLLSTAAALRHAQQGGLAREQIASVTIDGNAVDPQEAEAALTAFEKAIDDAEAAARAKAETAAADKSPSIFARVSRGVVLAKDWADENLAQPTGRWVKENAPSIATATATAATATTEIALSRPEDVDRRALVRIEKKDGTAIEVPVLVRDALASQILKATSATVGGVGLFPIVGNLVQGGTGLVAALASGASYLFGDKDLGRALFGMAKKHFVMGLIGFVPVVGTATGIQAAADIKRLGDSDVTVGQILDP